jgi:5'-3' exonuclease
LEEFGSISDILKHLDDPKMEKRCREAIKNNMEDLEMSMKLVALDEDISIDYGLQDLKLSQDSLNFSQNNDVSLFSTCVFTNLFKPFSY